MKKIDSVNIMEKFSLFTKEWTPKIIGELNGQYVKICKLKNIMFGIVMKMKMSYLWFLKEPC